MRIAAPLARLAVEPVPKTLRVPGPPAHTGPARLSALHRGILGLGTVLPGPDGGHSAHLIPQAFARVRPVRVQPDKGQTLIVGSDGDPGPPGSRLTKPNPRARTPLRQTASPVDALE